MTEENNNTEATEEQMTFTVSESQSNTQTEPMFYEPAKEPETTETSESEEQEEEETYDVINDDDYVELDEDLAWKYLKETKGISADNLDEFLTPKEQKKYAPELEKFQEFIEKTGNTDFNDFKATQKDWNEETPENTLKEFIKAKNPDLSKKELEFLYEEKYSIEDLDEEDDENLILKKGINTKTDLREAKEFLEKRKAEYMADGGSDAHIPESYREAKKTLENQSKQQEDYELARESTRNDYVSKTENIFTNDFEGFKLKFGNEKTGFEEVSIKPDNLQETKAEQMDINNFNRKFFDETTGELKDPQGFHKALYFGANADKVAEHFYNLGKAKQEESNDKLSKNITPEGMRTVNNNPNAIFTVRESKP